MQTGVRNAYLVVFEKIDDGAFGTFSREDDDVFEAERADVGKIVRFGKTGAIETGFDDCKMVGRGDNAGLLVHNRGGRGVLKTATTASGVILRGNGGQGEAGRGQGRVWIRLIHARRGKRIVRQREGVEGVAEAPP